MRVWGFFGRWIHINHLFSPIPAQKIALEHVHKFSQIIEKKFFMSSYEISVMFTDRWKQVVKTDSAAKITLFPHKIKLVFILKKFIFSILGFS